MCVNIESPDIVANLFLLIINEIYLYNLTDGIILLMEQMFFFDVKGYRLDF